MKSQEVIYINIMFYIVLELFWRYVFNNHFIQLGEYNQIVREIMIIITFTLILFINKELKTSDFELSKETIFIILIFGSLIYYIIFSNQGNVLLIYFKPIFFASIIEEIICRKLILDNINNILMAVIVSTLIFVILHFSTSIIQIIYYLIIGVLFSVIQLKTNNLSNVIFLHSIINLLIIIIGVE